MDPALVSGGKKKKKRFQLGCLYKTNTQNSGQDKLRFGQEGVSDSVVMVACLGVCSAE